MQPKANWDLGGGRAFLTQVTTKSSSSCITYALLPTLLMEDSRCLTTDKLVILKSGRIYYIWIVFYDLQRCSHCIISDHIHDNPEKRRYFIHFADKKLRVRNARCSQEYN